MQIQRGRGGRATSWPLTETPSVTPMFQPHPFCFKHLKARHLEAEDAAGSAP